jgi:hypothetical protein
MADEAVKNISDQVVVKLADLQRFIAMTGISDPRITATVADLVVLNNALQALSAPPPRKEVPKPVAQKGPDPKAKADDPKPVFSGSKK